MTIIKKMVDKINDEIEGAKEYAESYIECKASGNMADANKYKDMANQELQHAMFIHDVATKKIDELNKVMTPPQDMLDKWEHSHKEYVERVAWVKQMLAM